MSATGVRASIRQPPRRSTRREPAAQLVARQPRVLAEVGGGEAAQARARSHRPGASWRLDPLVDERDALVVLLDGGQRVARRPGVDCGDAAESTSASRRQ